MSKGQRCGSCEDERIWAARKTPTVAFLTSGFGEGPASVAILVADLLHGVGDELADLRVTVGGDGGDLGDLVVRGVILEVCNNGLDSKLDAPLEVYRVRG